METATAAACLGATSGCIMSQFRAVSDPTPSTLVGHTVKLAFASDSLTVRVERCDARFIYGRVIDGSGSAAIRVDDVRAARLEALSNTGRAQNLSIEQLRADPTIVDGGNVVFTTTSGDVLLRAISVLPSGWLAGTVVSHAPVEAALEQRSSEMANTAGLVRINLDEVRTVAIRETNTNKSIILTTVLVFTVGFVAYLSAATGALRTFHLGFPTLL